MGSEQPWAERGKATSILAPPTSAPDEEAEEHAEQQDDDDQLLLIGVEELFELGGSLFNFADGGGMVGPLHLSGEVRCSFVF